MHKRKSKTVTQAEIQARNGNLDAMELLARRYFDGRGVEQSHM
jgi:TPR repeat protein